jgi:hypothetical protein
VALGQLLWSMERRAVGWSLTLGERVPVLVLKSPHTMDRCWGGMVVIMSSMSCRASSSVILRFFNDLVGGR